MERWSRPGEGAQQARLKADHCQLIKVWDGETDAKAANDTLLDIIREDEDRHESTNAQMAQRSRFTRQHARKVRAQAKVLTIWLFQKWCNGRRLNAPYVYAHAIARIRRNHSRRP